jgi:arylsulfatase A-like enzyme
MSLPSPVSRRSVSRFAPHLVAFLYLALHATVLPAETRPNIIVIMADDQGWGDLSGHGHPTIRTPNLDGLSRDGAHFQRFYVQPVCAPTRAEFLTGRYHLRGGVTGVSEGLERLSLREETIADVLRQSGYATACFGKWHNGSQYPYHPNGRGFDEFYGFTSGHWGSYFDAMMDHNGQVETGRGYMADDLTDHTVEFIKKQASSSQPFFTFLAFNTPHSPMQVPDEYWDRWSDREVPAQHRFADREDREHSRAALAMVENLDANVGRILGELDQLGISENTIVVYLSDNGPNGHRWNGDLKGTKGTTDEGGVRSPLFLRWSGTVPPNSTINVPGGAIDLLPTLLELAAIEHPSKYPLDGKSFAGALLQTAPPPAARLIFSHWNDRVGVRGERWMLDHTGELFDLANDPLQYHAVTSSQPTIAATLQHAVDDWRAEMLATGADRHPPMLVGHPGTEYTPLPARDAELHGSLKRSNKYPNCSYVHQWYSADDYLSWPVEVPTSGRFEVEIYYTCAPENVGSELEFAWLGSSTRARITTAWNPPESGGEHDRIPRQESYVKDFKRFSLGEINLAAGSGTMALRVTDLAGDEAPEFRLLTLRRIR